MQGFKEQSFKAATFQGFKGSNGHARDEPAMHPRTSDKAAIRLAVDLGIAEAMP